MFSIPDRVCKFVANKPRFGRLHPRLVRAIIRSSIPPATLAQNWTKDITILTLEAIEADPWNAVNLNGQRTLIVLFWRRPIGPPNGAP